MNRADFDSTRRASELVGLCILFVCMIGLPAWAEQEKAGLKAQTGKDKGKAATNLVAEYDANLLAEVADPAKLDKLTQEELKAKFEEIMGMLKKESVEHSNLGNELYRIRRDRTESNDEVKAMRKQVDAIRMQMEEAVSRDPAVAAASLKARESQKRITALTMARAAVMRVSYRKEAEEKMAAETHSTQNLTTNKTDESMSNKGDQDKGGQ